MVAILFNAVEQFEHNPFEQRAPWTILLNDAEPLQQIDNITSKEGQMWNLVKIGQAVLEKTFKDQVMYNSQGTKFWL